MRLAVDCLSGNIASFCHDCRKIGANKHPQGKEQCQFGKCDYPLPKLNPYEQIVLDVFLTLHRSRQWDMISTGMGVPLKKSISYQSLFLLTDRLGIADLVDEMFIDKISDCADVLISQERESLEKDVEIRKQQSGRK